MKTITLDYCIWKRETFNIPTTGKWKKYFNAYFKEEDCRTSKDYEILDEYDLEDFIASNAHVEKDNIGDIELYDYE